MSGRTPESSDPQTLCAPVALCPIAALNAQTNANGSSYIAASRSDSGHVQILPGRTVETGTGVIGNDRLLYKQRQISN